MAIMPDFIEDYHNEVHDEEIAKNLRDLATEYKEKKDNIDRHSDAKNAFVKMYKDRSGRDPGVNIGQELRDLADEYKIKARDIAKPGIEDPQKFEELAQKHRPTPEYEQRMDRSDKNITASQEKMINQKEEFKEQEAQNAQEKNLVFDKEARRQKFRDEFNKTRDDITQERDNT